MMRNMKKSRFCLAAAVFLAAATFGAYGLDIGTTFNIGNLAFNPSRTASDTGFSGIYFPWGLSVFGSESLSNNLSVSATMDYNAPILRNVAYTTVTYQGDYFSIGVGPFFGFFNSASTPLNPGLTASVKVQIPGVVFLSYRGDSSLGSSLVQPGDYTQQRSDISLGYYIPNAIASLNVASRKYSEKTSAGDTIDQLTEYSFKTNLYQKNVPYRVLLTFGFQTLSKTFVAGSTTTTNQLDSLIVGTRFEIHVLGFMKFIADLQSSVYTFGQYALAGVSNPGPGGYLFQLNTGFVITLNK